LGWTRKDDVSTALIPQLYFDYLRGGPPGPLAGVVRHNQMDLRGLAALFGKMNRLLADATEVDPETQSLDLFGLSRFFQRRSEPARAFSACTQALKRGLPSDFRSQATLDLALLAKRRGDHEHAAKIWHELAGDESAGIHACIQLAMHYERRARDFARALQFARLALAKVQRFRILSQDRLAPARNSRWEQAILRRVARLECRMKCGGMSPLLPIGPIREARRVRGGQSSA